MSEAKHTPTPWRADETYINAWNDISRPDQEGNRSYLVAVTVFNFRSVDEAKANAAFICKAVNNHESLLTALRPFAEPHAMGDNYVKFAPRLIEAARAAIAKAEGKP